MSIKTIITELFMLLVIACESHWCLTVCIIQQEALIVKNEKGLSVGFGRSKSHVCKQNVCHSMSPDGPVINTASIEENGKPRASHSHISCIILTWHSPIGLHTLFPRASHGLCSCSQVWRIRAYLEQNIHHSSNLFKLGGYHPLPSAASSPLPPQGI